MSARRKLRKKWHPQLDQEDVTITSTVSEFAFFTPAVKPLLQRLAFRKDDCSTTTEIGPDEAAFIAARDSFYLASIGKDGRAYTQFLRGPKGCLQALDNAVFAFAGAHGSRQNVSPGNVLLFLMDSSAQRRLKIWAHSEICDNPLILESLSDASYSERMRHTFLFRVMDFEWDSPGAATPSKERSAGRSKAGELIPPSVQWRPRNRCE